jgi:hypothetical protein
LSYTFDFNYKNFLFYRHTTAKHQFNKNFLFHGRESSCLALIPPTIKEVDYSKSKSKNISKKYPNQNTITSNISIYSFFFIIKLNLRIYSLQKEKGLSTKTERKTDLKRKYWQSTNMHQKKKKGIKHNRQKRKIKLALQINN